MISPFKYSQRGNSITSLRIKTGLERRGYMIDLVSLEDKDVAAQVREALKQNPFLLHAFHARHWGKLLAEIPSLENMPVILTTTGTDLHQDLAQNDSYVIQGLSSADKIVLFHRDFEPLLSHPYPQLTDRLTVIPQGISLPEPSAPFALPPAIGPQDFVFYLPSGLRPVKNLELTLDGLESIQPNYPRLKLVIIGAAIDPSYSRQLLERIKTLPWVVWLGEIPHTVVSSLIRHCHAVINSSHCEGQPQGALEAMSLGLPCILTAAPGNLNLIQNGREGFYVHDAVEFSQAAKTLLDNPQLAARMGAAAQTLVKTRFAPENEINAYADLYRQLCP